LAFLNWKIRGISLSLVPLPLFLFLNAYFNSFLVIFYYPSETGENEILAFFMHTLSGKDFGAPKFFP